nr:MAG: hypothetical protein [Bacteriophage sp.]
MKFVSQLYYLPSACNVIPDAVASPKDKFAAYLDGKKLREIKYVHELQHILWALGLNAELRA